VPTHVIYTRLSPADLMAKLRELPGIMSGSVPDSLGIAHGFKMRVAVAFLEKVKLAFIVKSRGGTDEAGIKWPPLSKEYLAYGRRFGKGEQASLKKAAGLGKQHKFTPGGENGLLTKKQQDRWWQIYRQTLAWMASREPIGIAKGRAAAVAWAKIKEEGAKTKLEVYGNRQVETLRDTGVLFNSLQPGTITINGPDANYVPPLDQIVRDTQGELVVGTNVSYAKYHQGTQEKPGRRLIWPFVLPQAWLDYFSRMGESGLVAAVKLIARAA
jgi:hypothetical protein